jgi:hypothetical protein
MCKQSIKLQRNQQYLMQTFVAGALFCGTPNFKNGIFSTVHYQKHYSLLLSFCFVIGTTTKYEMITLYVRYLPFFMFSLLVV